MRSSWHFRVMYIVAALLLVLGAMQNCSKTQFRSTDNSQKTDHVYNTEAGGNGGAYDGKVVTFFVNRSDVEYQVALPGTIVDYSIAPSLPQGLSLNPLTGLISGTPTAVSPYTLYTVTASRPTDFVTLNVVIGVMNTTVFISTTTALTTEGSGPATLKLQMTNPQPFPVVVSYNTAGTTATVNQYRLSSGQITIPANKKEADIHYEITEDPAVTGERYLQINIVGTQGNNVYADQYYQFRHIILDAQTTYNKVRSISVGSTNGCAILETGALRCWGSNSYISGIVPREGGLGDGTTLQRAGAVAVDALSKYRQVSVGPFHGCGITDQAALKCWGINTVGQAGLGMAVKDQLSPAEVIPGESFSQVSAGGSHTCAINAQGVLRCWGANQRGQIGNGMTSDSYVYAPTVIDAGVKYKFVKAGQNATCAVTTAGLLKCWGFNRDGQLGIGSTSNEPITTPTPVDKETTYRKVEIADFDSFIQRAYACGLTENNKIKCWGTNLGYSLGNGGTKPQYLPQAIDTDTNYKNLGISDSGSCGVTTNNKLKCWGAFYTMNGMKRSMLPVVGHDLPKPAEVLSHLQITDFAISPGGMYGATACASTYNENLICWGSNSWGAGHGPGGLVKPTAVDSENKYNLLTNGCAQTTTGQLKCWGANKYNSASNSSIGDGTSSARYIPFNVKSPVTFAAFSSGEQGRSQCGFTANQEAYCWGATVNYSLGHNIQGSLSVPTPLPALNIYRKLVLGARLGLGLTYNGELNTWGFVGTGASFGLGDERWTIQNYETIQPGTIFKDMSTSVSHSCAINNNDRLSCWGKNEYGQLGDNSTTAKDILTPIDTNTTYKAVFTGTFSTCAITLLGQLKCWGWSRLVGDGTNSPRYSPVVIDGTTKYKKVVFNNATACALTEAGQVKCWGYGPVGDNTYSERLSPTNVDIGIKYLDIASGSMEGGSYGYGSESGFTDNNSHFCGITTNQDLKCWGANAAISGQNTALPWNRISDLEAP